uniref:U6 snRNA-associated Sm-like protein LSm8 n=2 Tax=Coturnix japonica TaxID=93934 RepID=A0A8C2TP19_COTJA
MLKAAYSQHLGFCSMRTRNTTRGHDFPLLDKHLNHSFTALGTSCSPLLPLKPSPALVLGWCGCSDGRASSERDGSGAGNGVTAVRRSAGAAAMTSALENYINRTVAVITSDGRMIVGTLKGFDQTINLILDESHERVFSSSQGVEQVVLGLYIVRGDNVAVIGEIDEETDSALDLGNIRAEPLGSVVH